MMSIKTRPISENDTNQEYGRWLSSPLAGYEVVVSGVSGRFPESDNVKEFRDNLFNKKDMVTESNALWKLNHPDIPKRLGKIYTTEKLDAGFFGIHHRQADIMDPGMRKILETAVEAVMDAGINPRELEGSKTGVFIAYCRGETEILTLTSLTQPQSFGITGYLHSLVANRVSYFLKLRGPSCSIDTACSSSGNALDVAFRSIRSGKCDNAIVASINIIGHPGTIREFFRMGVLSDDGKCKVFDEDASGYVRSEAVVSVLLQKSKNVRRSYGEIVYSKVNSDGFKEHGITFPSKLVQEQLMTEVLNDCQIKASRISYLEAHGTGTIVGDPEEVAAIDNAIGRKRTQPLLIGSLKSNAGHTEASSGLCSLVKLITAMETGYIPPNIHLIKVKKSLSGFREGRLKAVTEITKIDRDDAILGFNTFGFGGNNCQVLVKRFNKIKTNDGLPKYNSPILVCVSGRTEESVLILLNDLNKKQIDVEYVGLLHQIYKINFDTHLFRGFTILTKNGPLTSSIKPYKQQPSDLYVLFGVVENKYKILDQHLLLFPQFRATVAKIQKSMLEMQVKNMKSIDLLSTFVTEIGIVELLKVLNLSFKAVSTNWVGRLVCAYFSGNLTLDETITLFCEMESTSGFIPGGKKNRWNKRIDKSSVETLIFQEANNLDFLVNTISKNSIVLHVSDAATKTRGKDLSLKDNFLKIVGRLYEAGHNPQIQNLYPLIQFPVSRNTPIISPLLKWNYNKNWYTYKFDVNPKTSSLQQEHTICCQSQTFVEGHVIDGRNLIPTSEFLYLVWKTLAKSLQKLPLETSIVFENCRFARVVEVPSSGEVKLTVSIQKGSGRFEVVEENLIVSGTVRLLQDVEHHCTNFPSPVLEDKDSRNILRQNEIYQKLYLRGYNYSGLFKGIKKLSFDGSTGAVQWQNNFVVFIENLFQMCILQHDTKSLHLPIFMKKMSIDPQKHLIGAKGEKKLIYPVHCYKNCNTIKSGGIEISGLQTNKLLKKRPLPDPVLETYTFVPNVTETTLNHSIRINIQIILENVWEKNLKVVEIFDKFTKSGSKLISPRINEATKDIPLVVPDLTISTLSNIENIPNVKVSNFLFTPVSDLTLIIGTKLLQRFEYLQQILKSLKPNGFIITREDKNFVPQSLENLQPFTEHTTDTEKIILLQNCKTPSTNKFIEVSSQHFNWLSDLQQVVKTKQSVCVYSQNQFNGILGLVNCIRREPGGGKVKCFFMMDEAPAFDSASPFYQEQIKKNMAMNIFKNGSWGTYRHMLLDNVTKVESTHCYVDATAVDDLSKLKWLEGPLTEQTQLKDTEVLVYPYYSSLNFKDVAIATGSVRVDVFTKDRILQQYLQGLEFSGLDNKGRRVMGISSVAALATMTTAHPTFLWQVPDSWSLEEASTVPVVYATIIYAFFHMIKLKPGMSVLINSATGDIGLAALNVCLYHRCKIYVTIDDQEKRDYFKEWYPQIPDNHIGNSRDTSFEHIIKSGTKGRGVDVVLNSLGEEKVTASIRCLAFGGDFLDIGKFNFINDIPLETLLLEKQINYHGVSLDKIFQESAHRKWIVDNVAIGIDAGYVKPLPRIIFDCHEVEKAFRNMFTEQNVGKVVVKVRNENKDNTEIIPHKAIPRFNCDSKKSYIIVGGLGGFGLELADWLFLRGAKKIILVSRSGTRSGYVTQKIRNWAFYEAIVQISTHNVATKEGCISLIQEANQLGPVDGIFNTAVVVRHALLENQTQKDFSEAFAPKALATIHLDQVTREYCPHLRYFVTLSSMSSGRGNAGHTSYGMANSVMERICEQRKCDGLPALAIQWGPIGDVGLVARMLEKNKKLMLGGTLEQRMSSCLEVLDMFLKQDNAVVSSLVIAEKSEEYNSKSVLSTIAHILGIKDFKCINLNASLAEMGIDSIISTEVVQVLDRNFEITVTPKQVGGLTFAKLIEMEEERKRSKSIEYDNI